MGAEPVLACRCVRTVVSSGPEALAEGHLLRVAQRLPAEDQHRVVVEGDRDALEGGVVERLGEVHPADLGGECGMDGRDGERGRDGRHGGLLGGKF